MIQRTAPKVLAFILAAASLCSANDWPQWRGPDRNDISKETGVLHEWPSGGPRQAWLFKEGGKGYAGFSVVAGKLYTMRAVANTEELICLDANSGKLLWASPIGTLLTNKWGDGPRATPTVDGDKAYALCGSGTLACVDAKTGKLAWKTTMQQLGGKTPGWGYTESVLVDGPVVLCTPGGRQGAIAAIDKKTGKVAWQSKQFTDDAQYASIVPADINGVHQYVQLTMKSVVGVDAKTGKTLWQAEWPGKTAVIPTPVVKDNFVYVTSGYGVGCMLLEIGPKFDVKTVYKNTNMKNHHGGVILVGDHIYGHSDPAGWMCQDFKTGEIVWAEKKLGKGAIGCVTEGLAYCLEEATGAVVLLELNPKGWAEHGRFTLGPQTEIRSPQGKIWTHPVVSNGKLYLRDQDLIFCFDVSAGKPAE